MAWELKKKNEKSFCMAWEQRTKNLKLIDREKDKEGRLRAKRSETVGHRGTFPFMACYYCFRHMWAKMHCGWKKKRNTFQVTYRRQKPSPGASSCICWVTSSFSVVPPDNNSVLDPVIKERAGRSMRRVIRDRIYSYSIVRAGVPTLVIFVQQKSCVWGMQKRSGKKVHSVRHAILILHV